MNQEAGVVTVEQSLAEIYLVPGSRQNLSENGCGDQHREGKRSKTQL
jgi:hypothetical protein